MELSEKPGIVRIDSMPNFRPVDAGTTGYEQTQRRMKLFRSSRPDYITETEAHTFVNTLGIRCIIDFRSATEYRKANGHKLLDAIFPVYKVSHPLLLKYKPSDIVKLKKINVASNGEAKLDLISEELKQFERKHILINFFKMNYIWAIYNRAPWYVRIYSLLYLIVDLVLNTGGRYFVRVFAQSVLNHAGLAQQYIDICTYSQASICAALKILSDPNNLPAMVNCAHGKDRTGIVTAMVFSCLGKSKEFIAFDYAKSETELAPIKDRVYHEIVDQFKMSESFVSAKTETMLEVLDYLEKEYGSISNYLEAIGFPEADQIKLRRNLIEGSEV